MDEITLADVVTVGLAGALALVGVVFVAWFTPLLDWLMPVHREH